MFMALLMLFGFVFLMDLLLVIAVYVVFRFEQRRKQRRAFELANALRREKAKHEKENKDRAEPDAPDSIGPDI